MIPRLIHFIWIGPPMPWWARANIKRFKRLNPDFKCRVHGEEVLDERYRPGYDAINGDHTYGRKSDLLRVSALALSGGWYFDCDFFPVRPLRDLYRDYADFPAGCFLTQTFQQLVANGAIGVSLGSRCFRLIERRVRYLASRSAEIHWGGYGPALFTRVVKQCSKAVHMGEAGMFYPKQTGPHLYRRIARAEFSDEAIETAFGSDDALPYMFHLSMQDRLLLRDAMENVG